jgi:hypothetical protein
MDNDDNTLAQFIAHVSKVLKEQTHLFVKMEVISTFSKMQKLPEGALEWLNIKRQEFYAQMTEKEKQIYDRIFRQDAQAIIDELDRRILMGPNPELFWERLGNSGKR